MSRSWLKRGHSVHNECDWQYLSYDKDGELRNLHEYLQFRLRKMTSASTEGTSSQRAPDIKKWANPTAWSSTYKLFLSILGCVANFSTTYAGGSYTSGVNAMAREWDVSSTAVLVGVTIYTVGFAIAPMILAPLSELRGRRPVFIITGVLFVVGVLFCAVTRLYVGMLLARLLVGCASSTFAVVVVGVIADIYTETTERDQALALFTAGAMFGTGFGPLVSGFIVQQLGFRWLFWVLAIFLTVMVVVFVLFFKESRADILLSKEAKALNDWYDAAERELQGHRSGEENRESPSPPTTFRWKVKADEERGDLRQMVLLSLTRPFRLLVSEPIVIFFSLWAAFSWSIMYALLIIVPYTFQTIYGFDLQTSSAIFAAMCIGTIIITVISIFHNNIASILLPHLNHDGNPEARLYLAAVESILLPVGLFWYGWTANPSIHWIVPTLALACATMGMFAVYLAVFAYLTAAYRQHAASANAAQSFMRNIMGGAFPLFSRAMFQRLGFGGACSLLGGIGLVLSCVPWVLIVSGPSIRKRSRLAFDGVVT
jgi:multidrug resistance protein